MTSVTVLYIVGRVAPTSVPLEVAQFIQNPRIQLHAAAFYETDYTGGQLDVSPTRIDAKGRYDVSAVYRLYRYIEHVQPDVLHVHHTMPAFWGALLGKKIAGTRLVRSEHNNYESRSAGQRMIDAISQGFANLILCNSRNTCRSLKSWPANLFETQRRVVHNGVDVQRIAQAASDVPPFDEWHKGVTIGSVGRLIGQKNYLRLVRAFAQITDRSQKDIRLVLIGEGSRREIIETEVDRLGLDGRVVFTGEVDRDAVYAALHAFDLFVIPSLSEGFCNAAVEAMAAGLPMLCSDLRVLHEVVGDVGTYMDPEDTANMANALLSVIQEGPKGWERQGTAARKRAMEGFTVQRTAEKYVQSYLEVVKQDALRT